MHHKRKSEISHLYAKNVTRFSDQVHPLDITIGSHRVSKRKKEKEKIEKWWIDREKERQRKRERERERWGGRRGKSKNCTDTSVSGTFCFSFRHWRLKGHHRKFHTRAAYRHHPLVNFLSFYFTANLHCTPCRAPLRYCSLTKVNGITDESVNSIFFFLTYPRSSVHNRVHGFGWTRYVVTLHLIQEIWSDLATLHAQIINKVKALNIV